MYCSKVLQYSINTSWLWLGCVLAILLHVSCFVATGFAAPSDLADTIINQPDSFSYPVIGSAIGCSQDQKKTVPVRIKTNSYGELVYSPLKNPVREIAKIKSTIEEDSESG